MVIKLDLAKLMEMGLTRADLAALRLTQQKVGIKDGNPLLHANDFNSAHQTLSTTGRQELPGGLVKQWGVGATDVTGAATVVFLKPFPNACVSLKCEASGGAAAAGVSFVHDTLNPARISVFSNTAGTTRAAQTFDWEATGY